MAHYSIDAAVCRDCGTVTDAADFGGAAPGEKVQGPKPGHGSLCAICGAPSVFVLLPNGRLGLREMTEEEIVSAAKLPGFAAMMLETRARWFASTE